MIEAVCRKKIIIYLMDDRNRKRFVKIELSGLCCDQVLLRRKLIPLLIQSIMGTKGHVTHVSMIDTH